MHMHSLLSFNIDMKLKQRKSYPLLYALCCIYDERRPETFKALSRKLTQKIGVEFNTKVNTKKSVLNSTPKTVCLTLNCPPCCK